MSIQHTVAFTLIHAAFSAEEQAFLDRAERELAGIDGVTGFEINRQVSEKSDFAWQFSMRFDDQQAYDAYDAHPVHRNFVATAWVAEVEGFQELDFVVRGQA